MKVLRFALKFSTILLLAVLNQAQARFVPVITYQEMLSKSDLVVIADPVNKTASTDEKAILPNIWRRGKVGNRSTIEAIGVETEFSVSAVLKGNTTLKHFTLHHYREAPERDQLPGTLMTELNGPSLVDFDPTVLSNRRSYLLFLVREQDGRFAPVGGQTDPGIMSIISIPMDPH